MLLDKDNFKKLERKTTTVDFPEHDLQVKLRALSLQDQLEIDKASDDPGMIYKQMLCRSCVDKDGNPVFELEDSDNLPADLTKKIFDECCKLNNLGKNSVEELEKN